MLIVSQILLQILCILKIKDTGVGVQKLPILESTKFSMIVIFNEGSCDLD